MWCYLAYKWLTPEGIAAIAAVVGVIISAISYARSVHMQQASTQLTLFGQLQAELHRFEDMKKKGLSDEKIDAQMGDLLNTFEVLCGMYLNRTINRKDFENIYKSGLKEVVDEFRVELDTGDRRYGNIRDVYAKLYGVQPYQKPAGGAK